MLQLEDTGILKKVDQMFSEKEEGEDPMARMKICIRASEKISGSIDRLQRFLAQLVFPHFQELENMVHSKDQYIKCLERMINCVNPENIDLGRS